MHIVAKFGGTSMATKDSILQVASILRSNSLRRVCVVSAPGKSGSEDKITNLLLQNKTHKVIARLEKMVSQLFSTQDVFSHLVKKLQTSQSESARVAFGEYASGYILAQLLGWKFIDAISVIHFSKNDILVVGKEKILEYPCVIPGFYGLDIQQREIRLFSRGGSDISGAYIAAATNATMYENWTDVSGVYSKDPRHDPNAKHYEYLSYDSLEEIVRGGACVFHQEAVDPVRKKKIPTFIRNTFFPTERGTLIL